MKTQQNQKEKTHIPMYDSKELQRYYKEYIPIAQIENGKVLVR